MQLKNIAVLELYKVIQFMFIGILFLQTQNCSPKLTLKLCNLYSLVFHFYIYGVSFLHSHNCFASVELFTSGFSLYIVIKIHKNEYFKLAFMNRKMLEIIWEIFIFFETLCEVLTEDHMKIKILIWICNFKAVLLV